MQVALDLSYERTKAYIKPYVIEEIRGLADSTNGKLSEVQIRNVMWLGEITRQLPSTIRNDQHVSLPSMQTLPAMCDLTFVRRC